MLSVDNSHPDPMYDVPTDDRVDEPNPHPEHVIQAEIEETERAKATAGKRGEA